MARFGQPRECPACHKPVKRMHCDSPNCDWRRCEGHDRAIVFDPSQRRRFYVTPTKDAL